MRRFKVRFRIKQDNCKKTIIFLLLFLYIFNIVPSIGLPHIGTRIIISIIAIFYFLICKNKFSKTIWILYYANITQIFFSVFSAILNNTVDFWYVQFGIRNILYLSGAILINKLLPTQFRLSDLLKYIIFAILLNDILAALAFINPTIMQIIIQIQQLDEERTSKTVEFAVRMIGLGTGSYFTGGIINGLGIITTVYLITQKKLSIYIGSFIILILFVIGLFIARTTLIGAIIAILLYFKTTKVKDLLRLITISIFIVSIFLYLNPFESINTSHAFEVFEGTDGLLHNKSVEHLYTMYDIKMNYKTLLFGDGLSKLNGAYYMNTDVGWLRNILYFGIIGTLFGYVFYEFVLFFQWKKLAPHMILYIIALGLYLIILNFKGLPDYNFFIFLIIAFITNPDKHTNTDCRNEDSSYHKLIGNWRSTETSVGSYSPSDRTGT